jgi:hypothetical protein
MKRILVKLIYLISVIKLTLNINLRKEVKVMNIDLLLSHLQPLYNSLYQKMLKQQCDISKELTTNYFKKIESNTKIKYYLNKNLEDFNSIINDIILSMKITKNKFTYIFNIFEDEIPTHKEYFYNNNWVNFNILTTLISEEKSIAFGNLYVFKKQDKFDFIFCYGFGQFNRVFSGKTTILLNQNEYKVTQQSYVSSSLDFKDSYDEDYLFFFMNLIGFKIVGNEYNINLPYPEFN